MLRVLITGGTGSIGTNLCDFLTKKGFEISVLSSNATKTSKYKTYFWDYSNNFLETNAIKECDYIIHLAGAGIMDKRWTTKRKKEIVDSRVATTNFLFKKIKKHQIHLKGMIASSALGFYGQMSSKKVFSETDKPGVDFIGQTCLQWEDSIKAFEKLKTKTTILRLGIVLMKDAGALKIMTPPVQLGLGAILGSGKQRMPWIHYKDLNEIIFKTLKSDLSAGVYNCCSPTMTTNEEFTKTLAHSLEKKIWLPKIPIWLLSLILGERATLLTFGNRISVQKIINANFEFKYPELNIALRDIFSEKH